MVAVAIGAGVSVLRGRKAARDAKKQQRNVDAASAEKKRVEGIIQEEQAGRSRRAQTRAALTGQAQIEAVAQAGGNAGSSGQSAANASVASNVNVNMDNISGSLAASNALSEASTNLNNSGRKSSSQILNENISTSTVNSFIGEAFD